MRALSAVVVSLLVFAVAPATAGAAKWVGLGDSFAAGPLIPNQSLSPLGCLRSSNELRPAGRRERGTHADRRLLQRREDHGHDRRRRARARGPTRRSSTRSRRTPRSCRCRSAATTSASPRSSRTASPTTRSGAVPEPLQRRAATTRSRRGSRRPRRRSRPSSQRSSAVAGRAGARRQLRRDPARDRHRLLAAGAARLRRRAVPAQPSRRSSTRCSDRRAGHGAVCWSTTTRCRIGRDACRSSGTRWVEPLVPGNAAAPFHPNARGMAGIAPVVAAASVR